MSIVELERLDDGDRRYDGHVELAIKRRERRIVGDDTEAFEPQLGHLEGDLVPDGPCPPEAPAECGYWFCCPEGLDCVTGWRNGQKLCANRADGQLRQPCRIVSDVNTCEEPFECRALPGVRGLQPAV